MRSAHPRKLSSKKDKLAGAECGGGGREYVWVGRAYGGRIYGVWVLMRVVRRAESARLMVGACGVGSEDHASIGYDRPRRMIGAPGSGLP